MQLIINIPADEQGVNEFNTAFSQVQATLIKKCIDDLNIDNVSKQKVVAELLTTLKTQVNERKRENE